MSLASGKASPSPLLGLETAVVWAGLTGRVLSGVFIYLGWAWGLLIGGAPQRGSEWWGRRGTCLLESVPLAASWILSANWEGRMVDRTWWSCLQWWLGGPGLLSHKMAHQVTQRREQVYNGFSRRREGTSKQLQPRGGRRRHSTPSSRPGSMRTVEGGQPPT